MKNVSHVNVQQSTYITQNTTTYITQNITNYNYKLTTTKVRHVRPGSSAIDLGSRDSRTCLMMHGMVHHDDNN
jgi:hypothetical protein